jgi:hypothetical protein
MKANVLNFLESVLGTYGTDALAKAVERDPSLEVVLIPRTCLGWIQKKHNYNGNIPGCSNNLTFAKSDNGYTGSVTLDNSIYMFTNVEDIHVASALGVALGITLDGIKPRSTMLVKLGKSIDSLVEANLSKAIKPKIGVDAAGIGPAKAAAPVKPKGPIPPTESQAPSNKVDPAGPSSEAIPTPGLKLQPNGKIAGKAKPSLPRKSRTLTLPALKSECSMCGTNFFKSDRFKLCLCFADLENRMKCSTYNDGIVLEFKKNVNDEEYLTLRKELLGE